MFLGRGCRRRRVQSSPLCEDDSVVKIRLCNVEQPFQGEHRFEKDLACLSHVLSIEPKKQTSSGAATGIT